MDEIKDPDITVETYGDGKSVMLRAKNGKWLPGSKPLSTVKTSEQGKEMVVKRIQKARDVALQAVNNVALQSNVVIPDNIENDYIGWYAINDDIATGLFSQDNLRSKTEAAKFLGHNTGMIEKTDDNQPGSITVSNELAELVRNIADIVRGE